MSWSAKNMQFQAFFFKIIVDSKFLALFVIASIPDRQANQSPNFPLMNVIQKRSKLYYVVTVALNTQRQVEDMFCVIDCFFSLFFFK